MSSSTPPQGPIALFPVATMTAATILSIITITTCNLVEYSNPNAESSYRAAGLFCGDGYDNNVVGTIWSSAVVNTARFFAIGTCVVGGCTTLGLYPICCQRYNRCAKVMMCCICICCFPGQLLALIMLQSDFCWDIAGLRNYCSLGWGGVVCIVAAICWLLGAIAMMVVPHHAIERPPRQPKPASAAAKPASAADPEVGTTTITETINPDGTKETKKVTVNADGTKTIEITKEAAKKDDDDYDNIPIANAVPIPVPLPTAPPSAK